MMSQPGCQNDSGVYICVVVAIADEMHNNFECPALQTLRQQYALLLCSTAELQQRSSDTARTAVQIKTMAQELS